MNAHFSPTAQFLRRRGGGGYMCSRGIRRLTAGAVVVVVVGAVGAVGAVAVVGKRTHSMRRPGSRVAPCVN